MSAHLLNTRGIPLSMTYIVRCSRDRCTFNERKAADLDAVFELQDTHRDKHGEHHILEFERLKQKQFTVTTPD